MPDFAALGTAYSALAAHRRRTEVIAQNIANADTPGHSRLRADLAAAPGTGASGVFAGTPTRAGVDVAAVSRVRDEVLDQQARSASSRSAALAEQARASAQVEQRLGALGDGSLSTQLQALWNGFDDLANDPASLTARSAVLQRADGVAATLRDLAAGVADQRAGEVATLEARVREVNDLARGIAALHPAITAAHAAGTPANELLDRQDRMVDRLAELAGAQATRRPDGTASLQLDGHDLLSDGIARPVALAPGPLDVHGFARMDVVAGSSGRVLDVARGQVGGLLAVVNTTLPGHLGELDAVAGAIVATANPLHEGGRGLLDDTARPLFDADDPPTARSLQLAAALAGDPRHVAARTAGEGPLGAGTARALAALGEGATDPALRFDQLVGDVGAAVASLRARSEAAGAATTRAEGARTSVSGVSLDEELTTLVESQRAYEAAARLLTTVDEMLDVLINRTGLVGR